MTFSLQTLPGWAAGRMQEERETPEIEIGAIQPLSEWRGHLSCRVRVGTLESRTHREIAIIRFPIADRWEPDNNKTQLRL